MASGPLHAGNQQDYQDASDYLDAYGTLEGWVAPVGATYKTGEQLLDFWRSLGIDVNNPQAVKNQMAATVGYWNQAPKKAKYGKGLSAVGKVAGDLLPYVAAAAPFVGGTLGKIAAGKAFGGGTVGKVAAGLVGGNVSNDPLVNMAVRYGGANLLGDDLKKVQRYGAIGNTAAQLLGKGIYGPQTARQDAPGSPQTPKTMQDYWSGIGQAAQQNPNAVTSGNADAWMAVNFPGSRTPGSLNDIWKGIEEAGKTNPVTPQNSEEWMAKNFPGSRTPGTSAAVRYGGAGGGQGGGGGLQNLAAMGMLTSMLGEAFKKDNKPAPAPAGGGGYASLPTYGSLIGMATNKDAVEDQRNRLKYAGRVA